MFRLQINDQFVDKLNVLAQQYHVLLCLNSTEQFAYLQAHIAQTRFTQFRFLLQTSDTIDSIKTSYQTLKAHAATLQLSTVHILIHSSDIRVAHQVYQNLEDAAKQYLNLSLQYAGSFTLQTEQTTNSIDVSIQRIMYNWLENCESSAMLDNASSHFHLMPV